MARLKQISEAQLEADAADHLQTLFSEPGVTLQRTPFQNPYIQLLWRQHYVGSKGTVGRQLHYIVYYQGQAVGGISAGSAIFAHKKRDAFLKITKEEQQGGLRHIANNTMFRMTRPKDAPPLATEVLRVFKETVKKDWLEEYGDYIRAFETLVEPPRWGGIYKLDGWKRIGNTAGLGARRPEGHGTAGKNSTGVRKIIRVPVKIVWVLPICSYEEALAKSKGQNSYGDDSRLVVKCLEAASGQWMDPYRIAQETGVSIDRLSTILYMLQTSETPVAKNSKGQFAINKEQHELQATARKAG